jgi:hypothetical protein
VWFYLDLSFNDIDCDIDLNIEGFEKYLSDDTDIGFLLLPYSVNSELASNYEIFA